MKLEEIKKNESGMIMLESLIVFTVTIFLLFLILAIFSVLFQRWNIQVIANETAARVAQTYRFMEADTVTGEISDEELTEISIYRYVVEDDEMEAAALNKIVSYANTRLSDTTYTKNVTDPVITAAIESDAVARRHIEVTISGSYTVPFGEALSYFGISSIITYETTAYAECIDLINYVDTIDYVENATSLSSLNSKFVKMINKILALFDTIADFFGD